LLYFIEVIGHQGEGFSWVILGMRSAKLVLGLPFGGISAFFAA
jgi:hypothetical protein